MDVRYLSLFRETLPLSLRTNLSLLTLAAALVLAGMASSPPAQAAPPAGGEPLPAALRDLIRQTSLAQGRLGIQVADTATGQIIFAHHAGEPMKPASNMKLLTAAVALHMLGPEYTFKTEFLADRRPVEGAIQGNLYIRGHGAPALSGEQWWLMAREIRARGIRRITGDLVGDATWFDDESRPAGWPPPTEDAFYNAPISALSTDFGSITIVVTPTREGLPPEIVLTPFPSFFTVDNNALTRGNSTNLTVGRTFERGRNVITVGGRIALDAAPSISYRSVEQPTLYALAAFREAASREGIVIEGSNRQGVAPREGHLLYAHASRPLAELTRIMNKLSNNLTAESILKALGAAVSGPPGTTEKGAAVVRQFLRERGIDPTPLVIADGSGLSHDNRVTAAAFAQLLVAVQRDYTIATEFMASLAIGGVDGTLDDRMNGASAERRIRAKTGHLRDVTSLSGYAHTREGKLLAFSILSNASPTPWEVRRDIDRLCSALVDSPVPVRTEGALGGQP